MLIDTQCHIFPREYAELLKQNLTGAKILEKDGKLIFVYDGGATLAVDFARYDRPAFLRNMDEGGVDMALISCNIPDPGQLPAELAAEACTIINNEMDDWTRACPDRFRAVGQLPWNVPEAAVAEAGRIKQLGFKGVQLLTQNGGMYADDPALDPVWAACEELDLPVFIHPTVPTWHGATDKYNMTLTAGFPLDSSLTCIRLVYGGVLDRYPGLRFHQPHAGGILPWLDGRLSHHAKGAPKPNLPGGTVRDYIVGGRFWFDCCNPSPFVLKCFREYVGCDRLMFATDYPFLEPKDMLNFMAQVGYTPGELEQIRWKNANRFYGLGIE